MQETQDTWVQSLGQEDPPEEEKATHSTISDKSHWQKSLGSKKVRHDFATKHNNSPC